MVYSNLAQPLLMESFTEPTAVIDMAFGNIDKRYLRRSSGIDTHGHQTSSRQSLTHTAGPAWM
jgi:hypothetical protein